MCSVTKLICRSAAGLYPMAALMGALGLLCVCVCVGVCVGAWVQQMCMCDWDGEGIGSAAACESASW